MRRIIGVISDTHGLLRPEALAALRGSDYIIHAGDIGDSAILKQLAEIAPVTAIRGNVDREAWARQDPIDECAGSRRDFYLRSHNLNELDLKPEAAGFGVVVSGHTHVSKAGMKNGCFFQSGKRGAAEIWVTGDGRAIDDKCRQSLGRFVELLLG